MGVKALKREYEQATAQYKEMLQDISDIEKEVSENLASPDLLDRLKEQIKPIKDRYEQWSYIMFLLNEPVRNSKKAKYRSQNIKKINQLNPENSIESRKEAADNALKGLKEMSNGRTA